ncbi:hypothetical protein [Mucilaginibacter pineti]|nr:hypothetical protein [Mucilaginibacter pineti]
MAQAVVFIAVFDKFSYLCAFAYFGVSALAFHLKMPWPWHVGAMAVGLLFEIAIYQIDVWLEVTDPFKFLTKRNIVSVLVLFVFCVGFIQQSTAVVQLNLFTWNAIFDWIAILYVLLSAIPIAISVTDYLSAKTVTACKLKIKSTRRKQIPRVGTNNYLSASANGTDYEFVTTSVAYSVLKNTSEVTINLWHANSGQVFIKNDFLRQERKAWRFIQLKTTMLLLSLIVVAVGVVYYISR